MLSGVPAISPLWVWLAWSSARASPKSVSFTRWTPFPGRTFAGLTLPVDQSPLVRRGQAASHLDPDAQDLLDLQRTAVEDRGRELLSVDELHHQAGHRSVVADGVNVDGMLVADGGGGPGLVDFRHGDLLGGVEVAPGEAAAAEAMRRIFVENVRRRGPLIVDALPAFLTCAIAATNMIENIPYYASVASPLPRVC
jgi:hypothetical protein